jgi:hypothetical protein
MAAEAAIVSNLASIIMLPGHAVAGMTTWNRHDSVDIA